MVGTVRTFVLTAKGHRIITLGGRACTCSTVNIRDGGSRTAWVGTRSRERCMLIPRLLPGRMGPGLVVVEGHGQRTALISRRRSVAIRLCRDSSP